MKRNPEFCVAAYLGNQRYRHEADRGRVEAGLLKAGLPA
jgi:hypothetical protein